MNERGSNKQLKNIFFILIYLILLFLFILLILLFRGYAPVRPAEGVWDGEPCVISFLLVH